MTLLEQFDAVYGGPREYNDLKKRVVSASAVVAMDLVNDPASSNAQLQIAGEMMQDLFSFADSILWFVLDDITSVDDPDQAILDAVSAVVQSRIT